MDEPAWSIDSKYRFGIKDKSQYCLLKHGHEVAWGYDPSLLLQLADAMNELDEIKAKEKAA